MVRRVYIIGVGMTKFEKPGRTNLDYPDFAKEAVTKALDDCKLSINNVEQAFVGYVYGDMSQGQRCLYEIGMTGMPIINVNNNGATGSTALILAKQIIETGRDCILALGYEKMDRGSLTLKFSDRTSPGDKHIKLLSELVHMDSSPITAQLYGNAAKEHMEKYGTTPDHLAKIAYKSHKHSTKNPYAQFQIEYTIEQIKNSPRVCGPLTKLECCPTSDGAAAVILASEEFVRRHGLERQAVEIVGMEMATDLPSTFEDRSVIKLIGYDMTKAAAEKLFNKTLYKPTDVDVIELHDCYAANELIMYEALGLCPPGHAGRLVDAGDNTYGGKYVINPSGGLMSKGNPIGATGIAQCVELCWHLRGEAGSRQVIGAKLALQHNIGLGGAAVVGLYKLGFPQKNKNNVSVNKTKFSNSESDFEATRCLKILDAAMKNDTENLIEKVRGIYGLQVKKRNGLKGYWVIDTTTGKGTIKFNGKEKPDVTFFVNDEDLSDLLTGKLSPQTAYIQDKIAIRGNVILALRLIRLPYMSRKLINELQSKL